MGELKTDMREVFEQTIIMAPSPETWGFFVFRTTYENQVLWENYVSYLRCQASRFLTVQEHGFELLSNMDFTVVDDVTRLDGASKDEVRGLFNQMFEDLPEEGDSARGIPPYPYRFVGRYTHCFYYKS
ncbi:hypothetical protein F5X68DRAFT_237132 [Plectosphaerella plurivora]|uniref:Uncharacterized protein n=1 Tax=Plectosphaerella plurivora TaxID=936078 RepID=A0A9P8V1M6_9PEZI|nr:hypothetical protein F5X68DRAFT_237132 [Plectosphaerella plurivora]